MATVTADLTITELNTKIEGLSIAGSIEVLCRLFPGQVTFSTSFSLEDQVIFDLIAESGLPVEIFTLDTGRLFAETYSVWTATKEKYALPVTAYTPDYASLEPFIREKGPNAFYESVENRKQCCYIRKVEPLKRALSKKKIWITGLRAEHSGDRSHLPLLEYDGGNEVFKYNPLVRWTQEEVREYVSKNDVPYNILHDRGFVSIGCAPCTRAIRPGEDFRAGRWWWESADKKECGLHVHS